MESGTSFCLIVCFLVCSSEAQKIITAELGQDVILPCKVPNNNNIRAVEWSRPGLHPDHVLVYRDGRFDPDNQHPSYKNRVDLNEEKMKDGDVSLVLTNVTKNDTGRYECRVFEKGKNEPISIINLEVHLPAQTNIGAEKIKAELGQDVILPCKVPNNININITAVKWIRPDQEPEYVLFYRDGRLDTEKQHESYQNRVDLQDKEMKDGDFSLILKNVTKNDTGTYECLVFEEGKVDPINIIILVVHLSGDQDGNPGDGGDMTGIIVGSVVGVILLLAVVVGVLIYKRCRRQNPHHPVPRVEPPPIAMAAVP